MPSEKAKLNKALSVTCVACGKPVSTEVAVALTGVEDGHHKQYVVCNKCANGGWRPPGFVGMLSFRRE
ncbi:MAG: hypothetical protein ABSD30_04530 [Candidatus Binatus sp.]|jgi:hypothetical protein